MSSQEAKIIIGDAQTELSQVNAVHLNVAQEFIMITEDKTYRCLNEWKSKIEKRDAWIAPISLLASLGLTFVTATFKDALGISKDTWQAIFMIGIFGSFLWSVRALLKVRVASKSPSVDDVIQQLKKGAVVQRQVTEATKTEGMILR